MSANFALIITADTGQLQASFELRDELGAHLAYHLAEFKNIAAAQRDGLFDLRNYLRHYATGADDEATRLAEIGICIAEQVLGEEIFKRLWQAEDQRTLRIQLPGATEAENQLAAAIARVPWEIARPAANRPTLGERNLLVRVVHEMNEAASKPLDSQTDETLRVLFVFAEARGSRPLAARKERHELLQLFAKEIYPDRRIEAHFLTHGVTRERLHKQIEENSGYYIVHWSGHGHLNLLELAKAGGGSDRLSGDELLRLFTGAGGFIPRLFFLSACHSGDILRVKDWNDFAAIAAGKSPDAKTATATKEIQLDQQPGYTGTAHALLQGGVPSVVAMRYAVGDEYARDLAVEFYRALLAHKQPKHAAAALTMARRALLAAKDQSRYEACDHATPILYGAQQPDLHWAKGRSPALDTRDPRLHQIAELTEAQHEHFVGRTWELAGLGADFIGSDQQPVALITGLGGMGKTALTAEALALWEAGFDWVLLYQAKPNALSFETTLRDIHLKLVGELGRYHDHVQARPADAIYRDASADFTGADRFDRLTRNLIRALRDEAILLVLDNFETNLKPQPEAGGAHWACQDAAWDRCLARLAEELRGTRSRVLVTCRRPLAALAGKANSPVTLGPLPPGEAALYLREHAGLSRMFFGSDPAERALAMRLLNASRFHPLLMDRLARLATAQSPTGSPALRDELLQALAALEQRQDFAKLPELFAVGRGDARELAYLNDALAASLDQFIADASPDARRLLWMIAVANDPVELSLLRSVWSGESFEQQLLRRVSQMLKILPQLPPELQERMKTMPPEVYTMLDVLPPQAPAQTDPVFLLRYLIVVGLVTEESNGLEDEYPALTCHELVRERIRDWMRDDSRAQDRAGLSENIIRLAYVERLAAAFQVLETQNLPVALQAGSRALVYCVQAGAYDQLRDFAGSVINSHSDPRLLVSLLPHLQAAAESAPEGQPRYSCLCYLADALRQAGRPGASLLFYEQAAAQVHAAAQSDCQTAQQAQADLEVINGNWAIALRHLGDLDVARQRLLESVEAAKKAGSPLVNILGRELEALRIEIMQGRVAQALPQVEERLSKIEFWWQRYRAGHTVTEAPDPPILARALISALDIARQAHLALEDWQSTLHHTEAMLELKQMLQRPAEDLATTRMNRAVVLTDMHRFGEAQTELEACLQIFQDDIVNCSKVISSLARLFDKRGDLAEAIKQERRALVLIEQLRDPEDRASSHNNLALYLEHSGTPSALAESPRHQFAALVYRLVAGLGQEMKTSLGNYIKSFRRAHAAETRLAVPRVAAVLQDIPSLDAWLRGQQVDVDALQAAVDEWLDQARQWALAQPTEPPA